MPRLYIVRHGPAVDVGENGVENDADRMLSKEGIEKTLKAAGGLAAMNCRPWRIVSSPLVRAQETADILREVLKPEQGVEIEKRLAPGTSTKKLVRWLQDQSSYPTMLVGHMPDLARLASALVVGKQARANMTFKKAAACCITFNEDVDMGSGCLDWLIQPRHLRALDR